MSNAIHRTGRITTAVAGLALAALALTALPATAQEPAPEAESALQVTEAVVATGVEDRAPVGVADSFGADVGTVYFYTIFEGDFPATQLEHVWLREGEEMGRVSLRAQGPRWRTWSSKRITPDWTGAWEAQVVGPDGEVLASTSFTIGG